jgi:hypothetical protein
MNRLAASVIAASLLASAALQAKPPQDSPSGRDRASIAFTIEQRDAVQHYYAGKRGPGGCPPGLAKKNNGCLPPGQASKRYAVGRPLPSGIVLAPLEQELSVRIGPAPAGYIYAQVDGDLLKLVAGSLLVIDAIEGLSH